jgi:transposase InsO family protein
MQKKAAMEHVLSMGLTRSRARMCRVLKLNRSSMYYEHRADARKLSQEGLIEAVSREHPCWGYRKVTAILRGKHGECINAKRVARLRRREGLLASRRAGKRRRIHRDNSVRRSAACAGEVWSYDFIEDATAGGGKVRILSIIDEYTRECIFLRAGRSFPAQRVIDALEEIMICTGRKPQHIRSDNGPEFIAHKIQQWLEAMNIGPCYIQPGAPWENGHVESFHANLRAELLDRELFFNLKEVNACLQAWRDEYNFERPHGALHYSPPVAMREISLRPTASAKLHAGNQTP